MPRPRPPYPIEFRARMIDLVRAGPSVRSLSREFEVTETTIQLTGKNEAKSST